MPRGRPDRGRGSGWRAGARPGRCGLGTRSGPAGPRVDPTTSARSWTAGHRQQHCRDRGRAGRLRPHGRPPRVRGAGHAGHADAGRRPGRGDPSRPRRPPIWRSPGRLRGRL